MFGGMLMRLVPLLEFSLWGSDWGEYFHLADRLVQDGFHPERNLGWGRAYVDFPGLFDLNGAVVKVTGVGTVSSMTLIIPCVSAISCLLMACIVLKLGGGPWAALVSAGVMALMFPEVFTNSHPVPGPLGSVLVMAIMLVFIMGDAWRRDEGVDSIRPMTLHALLLLMLFVLTITHHLSLFFIIVVMAMAYLLRSALVHGSEPQRMFWGLWTIIAALSLATVYWVVLATTFSEEVMGDLAGVPGYVMMTVAWIGLLLTVLIGGVLGRRVRGPPDLAFWGPSLLRPTLMVFFLCASLIVVAVSFLGFPGTSIKPGPEMAIYVLPTVAVFALMVGSTDVVMRQHGGHVVVAWVAAMVASFLVTTAVQSHVLIPYRHIPYIVEAAAPMIGIGAVHLWRMLGSSRPSHGSPHRRSVAATAVCILAVAALVTTAYPPKAVMGGFQEGTTESCPSASAGRCRHGTRRDPSSTGSGMRRHGPPSRTSTHPTATDP
jgi:hypothetical protein